MTASVGSAASVLGVAVVFVISWWLLVRLAELPAILLPTPGGVVTAAWRERAALASATWVTAQTAALALALAMLSGTLIGILFSVSELLRRALFPYVVFLQTVPIVAIAPLLIVWSGYGTRTSVIAAVIVCLFPVVSGTTTGLLSASPEQLDLMRIGGATRWQTLRLVRIPAAVPQWLQGVRVASGLAVIGAIVAEFFVGNGSGAEGLGGVIPVWQGFNRTDALIAALGASTGLGLALFGLVELAGRWGLRRYL